MSPIEASGFRCGGGGIGAQCMADDRRVKYSVRKITRLVLQAAVDVQDLTGDPGGIVAAQIGDGRGNIV